MEDDAKNWSLKFCVNQDLVVMSAYKAVKKELDARLGEPERELLSEVEAGDASGVAAALERGADPQACRWRADEFGIQRKSSLCIAMDKGSPELVEVLLKGGADPNELDFNMGLLYRVLRQVGKLGVVNSLAIGKLLIDHGLDAAAPAQWGGDGEGLPRSFDAILRAQPGTDSSKRILRAHAIAKAEAGAALARAGSDAALARASSVAALASAASGSPEEGLFEAARHMDARAIETAAARGGSAGSEAFARVCVERGRPGWNPLRTAMAAGEVAAFEALLAAGADPSAPVGELAEALIGQGQREAAQCAVALAKAGALPRAAECSALCGALGWEDLAGEIAAAEPGRRPSRGLPRP